MAENNNKHIGAAIGSVVLSCLSIALFYALCWTAAADAQGAIALFLYAPILFGFIAVAFFLGRYASRRLSFGKIIRRASLVLAIFYLVFYISPFVGLSSFSNGVIDSVAKSFEMMTGKSPMDSDKGL